MNTWNAGQIATVIRTKAKMDVDYLGPDVTTQNSQIYQFMNVSLWKLARLAYNVEYSDPLTISADGNVAFLKNAAAIQNLFEPLTVMDATDSQVPKRYSYEAPIGWWVDSANQPFHVRGLNGTYRLRYIRLPRQITQDSDPVDMPETGYDALINEILGHIKQVKNYYEEATIMRNTAKEGYTLIEQAAQSARGPSSGGQPPSYDDVTKARGS